MDREDLKEKILKITGGVLETVVDIVLYEFLFMAEFGGSTGRKAAYGASERAFSDLYDINYQTIKNALYKLKRKGLIKSLKLAFYEEAMTKKGIQRLKNKIPVYEKSRPWDKRLYLVTYDIAEEQRNKRDIFRDFLRETGCALLQKSVWLTVYNPKTLVKKFVEQNNVSGQVLVSDLGPDGSIGDQTLRELIADVYHLQDLNERYGDYCFQSKQLKSPTIQERREAAFKFLSILKDDSQLPFELLPENWQGVKAYRLYCKLVGLD